MARFSASNRDSCSVFCQSLYPSSRSGSSTKVSSRKKSNHHSKTNVNGAEFMDDIRWVPSGSGNRNVNSDGQSPSSAAGIAAVGLDSQESSWIGLVYRPLSLLQKLLPGRLRNPALAESGPGCFSGDLRTSFVQEENEFLRQLDDILPLTHHAPPHLTYLRCQHEAASGLPEPGPGGHLPWITAESVRKVELQSAAEMGLDICQQTQIGYFSNIRTFLNQVLLSSQELKPAPGKDWVPEVVRSKPWWGSFLGREESNERGKLSGLSQPEEDTGTVCPQTSAEITGPVFVQRDGRESMLGENTGPSDHKEEPPNNGGLHTAQNTEGSTADHLSCSNTVLPAPDQDHGYSSLEEEQSQRSRLYKARAPGEDLPQQGADTAERPPAIMMEMEEEEERLEESTGTAVLVAPQNKTIAFIMGFPCSDDDSSQSDHQSTEDEEEEDDDDGFDSDGSSDCSTSSDEDEDDDEASDSEPDSESERLWNSLSCTLDPYNPRNFTACLHTSSTRPQTIPTPPSSTQSTPASSPEASPPPSSQDSWDDSASASEVDEADSLRLLNSFSCASDPYSPFNFQAPLRTRGPTGSPLKTKVRAKTASQTQSTSSPPEYRQQEAEERLDSGFSESNTTSQTCRRPKKVRFRDDVEEFFASCGEEEEDRRGPWEELARDRCRFLRRCQEVEQSIGFCLQPQHRLLVYRRLTVLRVQEA